MTLIKRLALGGAALLLALSGLLVFAPTPSASAQTTVSGTWTLSECTASGTYAPLIGQMTATISGSVIISGDVSGTFTFTATYNSAVPDWRSTSNVASGSLTIGGETHPVKFFGMVAPSNFNIGPPGFPSPSPVSFTGIGHVIIWTTDEPHMLACASVSGSGSATMSFSDLGNYVYGWEWTGISASGTWTGSLLNLADEPQAPTVTPGSGTVTLPGALGSIAELDYTTTGSGVILLARYESNPGGTPPRPTLDKYVEIDSSIGTEINWPVELRVYYTDAEVATAGMDETLLRMYKWTGSSWVLVANSGVNTSQNYVWARLTSFSTYAPMETLQAQTGEGCFIATAAYGSYLDSHVQTLRDFRDSYMVTNPVGRSLVSTYYRLSPPLAEFIDGHPALKPIVRVGLLPAVAASEVALGTTLAQKIAILAGTALVCVALVVCLRRKAVKGGF